MKPTETPCPACGGTGTVRDEERYETRAMRDDECLTWAQHIENGLFGFQQANMQLVLHRKARKPNHGEIAAWEAQREKAARMMQEAIQHMAGDGDLSVRIAAVERENAALTAFLLVLFATKAVMA